MARALILSFVEWGGAFQRPHHLALGLARRGWDVHYLAPGYVHRRSRQFASGLELPPNLSLHAPPALPGASRLAIMAALNDRLARRRLHQLAGAWDLIIFNDPRYAAMAEGLDARRRVFDCMDDLSAMAHSGDWALRQEARALDVADRVWTGTASLAERHRSRHAHVHFVPCGVDAGHFASADAGAVRCAARELPPGDGPLAGYFGMINERVDIELIEALLEATPWRVVLIGPSNSRAPRLPESPRCRWLGPRAYADLPAYLAHFDLALIPYDTQGPHRFLYPVKALEYLAAAKPVLSTSLPDVVRFLSDYVERADGPGEWAAAGRRLAQSRDDARRRALAGQDYARSRTWDAMVDEMLEDLNAETTA